MNIALSTIVLFSLLLPGIFFRRFYYSSEFSQEYFKESFFSIFISTIIPSLIFQTIWFFGINLFDQKVDLYIFADIISQRPSKASYTNINENALKIFFYNFSMILIALFSGYSFRKIVRIWKLDRTFKILRFKNSWHYILKGEFFDFPDADINLIKDKVEEIEFVFVDAITELNGTAILYDGFLVAYDLDNNGGLESITLKDVKRRLFSNDCSVLDNGDRIDNRNKYYSVNGHLMLLKYSEIKNLNFTYYKLDKINGNYQIRLIE